MPRRNPNQIIENGEVIYELKPLKKDKKFIAIQYILIPVIAIIIFIINRGLLLVVLLTGLIILIGLGIAKLVTNVFKVDIKEEDEN